MKNYDWKKYNLKRSLIAKKIVEFNKKSKFNFLEKKPYNHIRDIFCLSITTLKKSKRLKVLDYGSNVISLSNIKNKINTNEYKFFIYDPFEKNKKPSLKPLKYEIINNESDIKKVHFDIINFGSSIQYIYDLKRLSKIINFSKTYRIIITHTPITLKKEFITKQSNHKNLKQIIYNYDYLQSFFKKKKFKLIFKSRIENIYTASLKNKSSTFSLNLIFDKIYD